MICHEPQIFRMKITREKKKSPMSVIHVIRHHFSLTQQMIMSDDRSAREREVGQKKQNYPATQC